MTTPGPGDGPLRAAIRSGRDPDPGGDRPGTDPDPAAPPIRSRPARDSPRS